MTSYAGYDGKPGVSVENIAYTVVVAGAVLSLSLA